jgi:DNA mismatch repair ATPase MutL
MTPRRSSRARLTQPPAPPTHTNSSTSLNSLTRAERNTRSNNKLSSPRDSVAQRSESAEDPERPDLGDPPAARLSRRSNTNEKEDAAKKSQQSQEYEEAESEEITRCICGNAEYPGPPSFSRDVNRHHNTKAGVKEEAGPKHTNGPDGLLDDTGNFFIQCDNCQVWQHGGCVGLLDESMSPDEYFCEECKPEFHKIQRNPTG